MDIYYIDGEFVTEDKAVISAKDLTVLRGFGVFDFLITYNKRPFYLKEHVQRLENSADKIGLKLNHTNEEICAIVEETVRRNTHHDESNIRIVYTGGVSSDGVTPEGNGIVDGDGDPQAGAARLVVYGRRQDHYSRHRALYSGRQEHQLPDRRLGLAAGPPPECHRIDLC